MMNIDVNRVKAESEYIKRCKGSQVVVECDIDTESKGGLSKILTVTGDVTLGHVDCFKGEVKVSGKVSYKVSYLDKDNAMRGVEYCSDFSSAISNSEITQDSLVNAHIKLLDIDSMAKGDSIRLQAAVDISLDVVEKVSFDIVKDVSDTLTKCKTLKIGKHIASIDEKFELSDEYMAGCNIDRILMFDTEVFVSTLSLDKDKLIVGGEAAVDILYMSEGKEYSKNMLIPISERVNCFGADVTSKAKVDVCVDDARIVLGGVEDNNSIKAELTISVRGDAFDYQEEEILEDVCSNDVELDITRDDITLSELMDYRSINERVQGEVHLEENIKKLLSATHLVGDMTNCKINADSIDIDVLSKVGIAYQNQEGEIKTTIVELPATLNLPYDGIMEGDDVTLNLSIMGVTSRVKRDRDIDVTLDVRVGANVIRNVTSSIITNVECKAPKVNNHKIMTIYFVKDGDSMWDIVKNIGATESVIRSMNKDVDFDNLKQGDKVIVFRGINK